MLESLLESEEFKQQCVASMPQGSSLSKAEIEYGFNFILNRSPSHEEILDKQKNIRDLSHLRDQLLWSREFRDKSPQCSPAATNYDIWSTLENGFKIKVNLTDRSIGIPILEGKYELEETNFIKSHVKAGDHVLDIGANIGYFSLVMADLVGEKGRVDAFEPLPFLYSLFEDSIRKNDLANRVVLNKKVLSSKDGLVSLCAANFGETPNNGGAHLSSEAESLPMGHAVYECDAVRLDSLHFDSPVSFIKLDVEGAEPLVMKGAEICLQNHKPTILSEIHKEQLHRVSGTSSRDFMRMMKDYGYSAYKLKTNSSQVVIDTSREVENVVFRPDAN